MHAGRPQDPPHRDRKSKRTPNRVVANRLRSKKSEAQFVEFTGSPAPGARDPLENSIPFLLRRTSRYFRLALQKRLKQHGLGFSHWFYLRALWLEDGITQRELCKRIEAVEPAAVTALAGLERSGYIRRVPDKANRRQVKIYITALGRGLEDDLLPFAAAISAKGVEGISARDLAVACSVLNRIRSNMSEFLASEA